MARNANQPISRWPDSPAAAVPSVGDGGRYVARDGGPSSPSPERARPRRRPVDERRGPLDHSVDHIACPPGKPQDAGHDRRRPIGEGFTRRILLPEVDVSPRPPEGLALPEREVARRILLASAVPLEAIVEVDGEVTSTRTRLARSPDFWISIPRRRRRSRRTTTTPAGRECSSSSVPRAFRAAALVAAPTRAYGPDNPVEAQQRGCGHPRTGVRQSSAGTPSASSDAGRSGLDGGAKDRGTRGAPRARGSGPYESLRDLGVSLCLGVSLFLSPRGRRACRTAAAASRKAARSASDIAIRRRPSSVRPRQGPLRLVKNAPALFQPLKVGDELGERTVFTRSRTRSTRRSGSRS